MEAGVKGPGQGGRWGGQAGKESWLGGRSPLCWKRAEGGWENGDWDLLQTIRLLCRIQQGCLFFFLN